MKKFFRSVINLKDKELNWFNCNFCYAATILMICIMLICNFLLATPIQNLINQDIRWNMIFCSFWYNGGNFHLLGNIMGLITLSVFVERHFGSLKYALLLFPCIPIANLACFAMLNYWGVGGFSCVEYFWYANIIWLLIFNFKTYFMGKFRWIFPVVLIGVILIMMSWAWSGDGMNGVGLDFCNCLLEPQHYGPFIIGICTGLFANLYNFVIHKKAK